jgi:MoxR-like ATPase
LFRINFDEGLERSEFIGSNTIENGNVVWKAGTLTQAIRHAGAIILLDEVGFARAQNISPLHAVTERSVHRALVIAETGERFQVANKVVFFAADNSVGHGDESGNFAGVREQNSAFLDRFSYTLRFTYLPHSDEVDLIYKRTGLPRSAADLLVQFANIARKKAQAGTLTQPPSLRQMFAWAAAVQDGMPVSMAFKNAIINKFPADCEAELQGIYSAVVDAAKLQSYLVRN